MSAYGESLNLRTSTWEFGMLQPGARDRTMPADKTASVIASEKLRETRTLSLGQNDAIITNSATLAKSSSRPWGWAWRLTRRLVRTHQAKKRLRVCETLSLGDKRFIAVVQVDGEQFLLGGAPNALSILAHLKGERTFPDILRERCEQDRTTP
jgi:Flagellar biosynthesis protein, FliO